MGTVTNPSFFDDPTTVEAIRTLARADTLTVFVGAGASMESALPSWSALIARMLDRVAAPHQLDADHRQMFRTLTATADGVTGAGAVVKATLGARFTTELRRALYGDAEAFEPGPTALAAARLRLYHDAGELVTTNYDNLLEQALLREQERQVATEDAVAARRVVVRATKRRPASKHVAVHHLHGYLAPGARRRGEVVLSEEEYVRMQGRRSWQEEEFVRWLQTTTCLFVGTSLTDTNLLRYLYLAPSERRHYAVFVRQADSALVDQEVPSTVRLARERTAGNRWRAVNVEPLYADFYSESAQLLYEIVQRRALGRHHKPYTKRMRSWRTALARTTLPEQNPAFSAAQDQLQSQLSNLVDGIRTICQEAGTRIPRDESFMAGLWVRNEERELTLWASSDRAWRHAETLEPVSIKVDSPWASVQAVCTGSLVTRSTADDSTTRWNHVIAIPVFLDDEGGGRLPVGAITLASKRQASDSLWTRASAELRAHLAEILSLVGRQALAPAGPDAPAAPDALSHH